MKQVASDKHPAVVAVPDVVGVVIVAVEPPVVVIAFNVEHLEIAVRVSCV